MDSSRGRSDDAAKALAATKRSVRAAESGLNDATKRREQRIASAHRAVDNAQERLSSVANELQTLSADPDASPAAIAKVKGELATEQSHLQTAQADVDTVTQEAQASVDQAQQNLWALQRELAAAEKAAEAAKTEATARKDEYDGMYRDAQAKERAREEAIKAGESKVRDLNKTLDAAENRARTAQAVLNEAQEIHDHPETTEGLRERIANEEDDLADAQADLEDLLALERDLRRSTRTSRIAFVVAAVAIVALVVLLVWFFLLRSQP
jgi:chromosome segregation ATPase